MGIDYTKRPGTPEPAPESGTAGGAAPVSLSKVTLTKAAPSVSLSKRGGASGILRVNLNWNARPAGAPQGGGGFLKRLTGGGGGGSIDLDLAALYEYTDGSKGVVQALGNAFRDTRRGEAITWLDGDDRSGTSTGGENLFVNLAHVSEIRRILVFAFIYQGVPNWAAADGVVTLHPASGPEIEVRLDEHDPRSPMCAIAMIENTGGELSVNREVRYIQGSQAELDRQYGWGMNWTAGRK